MKLILSIYAKIINFHKFNMRTDNLKIRSLSRFIYLLPMLNRPIIHFIDYDDNERSEYILS